MHVVQSSAVQLLVKPLVGPLEICAKRASVECIDVANILR